jgi:hypothetical protein
MINPELEPVQTLACEPPQALALDWLPLAVRYKLDRCGRKISLQQWRSLPHAKRAALLKAPMHAEPGGINFERMLDQDARIRTAAGPSMEQQDRVVEREPATPSFAEYANSKLASASANARLGDADRGHQRRKPLELP